MHVEYTGPKIVNLQVEEFVWIQISLINNKCTAKDSPVCFVIYI